MYDKDVAAGERVEYVNGKEGTEEEEWEEEEEEVEESKAGVVGGE